MATRLVKLKLSELSLVDEGANEAATVCITKRRDETGPSGSCEPGKGDHPGAPGKETTMTTRTDADFATLQAQHEELKKNLTTATADIATLTKRATDAEAKVEAAEAIAKSAGDEVITVGTTEIRKSKVGAETFAAFKAQAEDVAKAREDALLVELTKRAETDFAALPGEPIAKAKALRAIAKMGEAERTTVETLLKAGNAALKAGMTEVGKGGGVEGDAEAKLDQLAKAKAGPGASREAVAAAYDEVLKSDEGKALYRESIGR